MKVQYEYLSPQTILLSFPHFRILLDPEIDCVVEYGTVDLILVSTYRSPVICHILNYSGFSGDVLMALPTMEYLTLYTLDTNKYVTHEIEHMKQKIRPVYYHHEQRFLDIVVRALPAGTGIGFANWSIRCGSAHIVYSHNWMKPKRRVIPMDVKTLSNCDILLCTQNLEPSQRVLGKGWVELWGDIYERIKQKAHVVVVTEAIESMFDSLEALHHLLDSAGVKHVPIHVVSSIAKHSLSLTNVMSEWMDQERQQQAMQGQSWILHGLLERRNIICHDQVNSVLDYPEPRLIVCTHTCLLSCLDLSHKFDGLLCLFADTDENDMPVAQYPDCQFKLYRETKQNTSIKEFRAFLDLIRPTHIVDSKIKGEIEIHIDYEVDMSNEILEMQMDGEQVDVSGAIYRKDTNTIHLSGIL
jgi:hypothetical protein